MCIDDCGNFYQTDVTVSTVNHINRRQKSIRTL